MDGFSNLRGNEEVNASLVKNITFVAKFLTLGQWDPSSYLQTHDQVWCQLGMKCQEMIVEKNYYG